MTRVLVLDPIHEEGLALLRARADVDLHHLPEPETADLEGALAEAEILVLRGRHLGDAPFEQASRLRLVSRHGVGCDNLNFPLLAARGVTVAVTDKANLVSVAEHAFMLLLAAYKNLLRSDAAVRSGDWQSRDRLGARELAGSALLVVGFGRIGQAFAQRAAAFGARIAVYDPALPADAVLPEGFQRYSDLGVAVAEADAVSLHLPRRPDTLGLVSAGLLACFRPGAILVNSARGGIVEERALCAALDSGQIALYASDVLASEPPAADDPLLGRPDVILTPHSAAMTDQGARRMAVDSAQNALDFIDGCLSPSAIALAPA